MIIKVRVIPNSKSESIEELAPQTYRIKFREKETEGKADNAVISMLLEHFKARKPAPWC
ncbi:MAG: DUF167 domain-containing protein [Candidatus Micrarchaeales archaeon]|nr:DUF167 domain-containing protein [Candidatus Micrarchaeales archaeon]